MFILLGHFFLFHISIGGSFSREACVYLPWVGTKGETWSGGRAESLGTPVSRTRSSTCSLATERECPGTFLIVVRDCLLIFTSSISSLIYFFIHGKNNRNELLTFFGGESLQTSCENSVLCSICQAKNL